ncbi:MAG TPA: M1 family metallopeptidase [Cytophagales bacterium]|nr:M1 family metallopeptidase [Cytophagales bacterium]
MKVKFLIAFVLFSQVLELAAQNNHGKKFEQLGPELATPNVYRTASGAPGHLYWQQKADYEISAEINDETQVLTGSEKITYTNNSPDPLSYLWVQLDQNHYSKESDTYSTQTSNIGPGLTKKQVKNIIGHDYDLGYKIKFVRDNAGKDLSYTINKTMMRVDLPSPLASGQKVDLFIDWTFNIHDRIELGGRGGQEFFPGDGNYIYTIAQWFPRMAVYSDNQGWQNKQFLGQGEFALPFGEYKVKITVPSDFMIASTGTLQNANEVLEKDELERWEKAQNTFDKPVIIRSQKEAEKLEKGKAKGKKTWIYHAENVRDFAFGASRKFIWDAMAVQIGGKKVMAMSYYPKEANPLYEKYSTKVVAHTLKVYSKHTIDYPYPVAISVEAQNGMEYPMICFNYGRPEKDGTYSDKIKYGMISVIIHEVGHNFFPMIINSDERQWTWMDEGLNSFVQFLAEQEWDRNYPSKRGPAPNIVPYMKSAQESQEPIMTNSEQIIQFGNNAYGKPATALNILRETVMGRELFDYAFKEYAQRWKFKHPTPEDLFRTMEDASAVDLDWFWRGWFYTTDNVDIAIENVKWYQFDSRNPAVEGPIAQKKFEDSVRHVSMQNNEGQETAIEKDPTLKDFYNTNNPFEPLPSDIKAYNAYMSSLDSEEKKLLASGKNFYEITFNNIGGLVMPLILEFTFVDGTKEVQRIPAEIWRKNDTTVTKVFVKDKEVTSIHLDPYRETADVEVDNNFWPERKVPSRFELYKKRTVPVPNAMQKKRNR